MTILFFTSCGADYPKAWIFPTLGMLSSQTVCLLHPTDGRPLPLSTDRVRFTGDRFYQDGRFLDSVPPLPPDRIVILADADAVLQRDFSDSELKLLDSLDDNSILAGPNMNMATNQLGAAELELLKPIAPLEKIAASLKVDVADLLECRMRNWGLVAARVSAWRTLQDHYAEAVGDANPQDWFTHPTWMQYLLCVMVHRHKMTLVDMPYTMHSHAHFGLTTWHGIKNRVLFYKGERVLYAHYCQGVTH